MDVEADVPAEAKAQLAAASPDNGHTKGVAMAKHKKPGQRAMWARVGQIKLARLDAKRDAARQGDALRAAEHAWRAHVVTLPFPRRWADLATRFVETVRTKRPDVTVALVLLCLSLVSDWEELVDGGWIFHTSAHRYVYFAGQGYGDARTYDLLSKLFRWLHADGRIDDDQLCWLLEETDDGRESVGLSRRHGPRTRDEHFLRSEVEALAARFAPTLDDPRLADAAPSMLGLLATHLAGPTGAVRFGRLQVQPFVTRLLSPCTPHPARDIVDFARALLHLASRFYRWLVEETYLDHELGERLASELGLSAVRLVAPDAAGSGGLV